MSALRQFAESSRFDATLFDITATKATGKDSEDGQSVSFTASSDEKDKLGLSFYDSDANLEYGLTDPDGGRPRLHLRGWLDPVLRHAVNRAKESLLPQDSLYLPPSSTFHRLRRKRYRLPQFEVVMTS